jgi:hypothetical protein
LRGQTDRLSPRWLRSTKCCLGSRRGRAERDTMALNRRIRRSARTRL